MKRIITGVRPDGTSYVVSRYEFEADEFWRYEFDPHGAVEQWIKDVDPVLADAASAAVPAVPGGVNFYHIVIKPQHRHSGDKPTVGMDSEGRHLTRTADFGVVLTGELDLILDDETVTLRPGDFVIQQATRHAWHNTQKIPATLGFVVTRPVYVQ